MVLPERVQVTAVMLAIVEHSGEAVEEGVIVDGNVKTSWSVFI